MDWNSAGQKSVSQQTAVTHLWTMDILGEEKKKKKSRFQGQGDILYMGGGTGERENKERFQNRFLRKLVF